MKTSYRIFFWEGLVLVLFAALTLFFVSFETVYELLFPIVFGGIGLAGLVLGLVLYLIDLSKTGEKRQGETMGAGRVKLTTKFGANAITYSAVFLGILIFANILGSGHVKKIDLTSAKVNTLSDQTKTVLQNLPAGTELTMVGFFKTGEARNFEQLAGKYKDLDQRVTYRSIDPDLYPEEVKRYAVSERGAIAVSCDRPGQSPEQKQTADRCTGQTNITMDLSEQGLTTAVIKVSAPQAGKIYFIQGHGEVPLDGAEERGYALIRKGIENENIVLEPLTMLTSAQIPQDARALVIAGPTKKFQPEEVAAIGNYLQGGGRVLAMIDPQTETGLEGLLAGYGIQPQNNIIVDRQVRMYQGSVLGLDPIVVNYGPHEITKKFGENPTLFHEARSLKIITEGRLDGVDTQPLLNTGEESWGETDFGFFAKQGVDPTFDPAKDSKGPLVLGAVAERTFGEGEAKKTARLAVIGDSDFIGNKYAPQGYNADLFFNTLNWLTGQEAYISVRPNSFAPDVFTMTEQDTALLFFASVFLLPQFAAMLGIGVAIRRRR
ncbi:MAG: GldG family protein [Myxococcales bacterium]|nr:GldG family protein [Myxococcales bacterium]